MLSQESKFRLDFLDYAKPDLLQFNISCVNLLMTVTVFAAVPLTQQGGEYLTVTESGTNQHAMAVLTILNLIVLVNESTNIFSKKPIFISFSGNKRIITVVIAIVLWIVVLVVTIMVPGKEIVMLLWIATSLCISGFQMLYIIMCIIIDA